MQFLPEHFTKAGVMDLLSAPREAPHGGFVDPATLDMTRPLGELCAVPVADELQLIMTLHQKGMQIVADENVMSEAYFDDPTHKPSYLCLRSVDPHAIMASGYLEKILSLGLMFYREKNKNTGAESVEGDTPIPWSIYRASASHAEVTFAWEGKPIYMVMITTPGLERTHDHYLQFTVDK
tara:strand:+ start:94 stop:633 length:540 start_codon:yes stop_codon:yes gene_type:complete